MVAESVAAQSLTLRAHGKLNLSLKICGRHKNGLHLLDSDFVLVEHHDDITLTPRVDNKIIRTWKHESISDEDDLSLHAARRLRESIHSATTYGVSIHIDKRLPIGGGMGGASSNAAAVLHGLNQLWNLKLSLQQLLTIAAPLGSDIAFFLYRTAAARVQGTGDIVCPTLAADIPQHHYLLLIPPLHISTAAVYAQYRQYSEQGKQHAPPKFMESDNDLTAAAFACYPELESHAKQLHAACGQANLSGSGATLFAAFSTKPQAAAAQAKLPANSKALITYLYRI